MFDSGPESNSLPGFTKLPLLIRFAAHLHDTAAMYTYSGSNATENSLPRARAHLHYNLFKLIVIETRIAILRYLR